MGAVGLFLVTSLVGRVWCGFTCPQTVWTDLFMWVERLIEGDRNERMKRDAAPVSLDTVWRKTLKHAVWLGIAFWTGGAWIMYYVDAPTVTVEFWTGAASTQVYFFTFLFTATTYLLAGWAREQVCTYMCPWPRFQSAMLDEQSLTVTYQGWRGEPRHARQAACRRRRRRLHRLRRLRHRLSHRHRHPRRHPAGMHQLRLVHRRLQPRDGEDRPAALADHLGHAGRPGGEGARRHRPASACSVPRTIIYVSALVLAVCVMGVALATRSGLGISVLHDRAPLFVRLANGDLRNGYTVKIVNKANTQALFELSVQGLPGAVLTEADEGLGPAAQLGLPVNADSVGTFRVMVAGQPAALQDGEQAINFMLSNTLTGEHTVYRSLFMGPGAKLR